MPVGGDQHIWEARSRDEVPSAYRAALAALLDQRRAAVELPAHLLRLPAGLVWQSWHPDPGARSGRRTMLAVSEVGFSPDSTVAVVYLESDCGIQCAGGRLALMRRGADGSWEVERFVQLWAS